MNYPRGMRLLFILMLLLPCHSALAVVCKTIDAEGHVSYSDVSVSECQNPVRLPESSTYKPRQLPSSILPKQQADSEAFAGYTRMRIAQPETGGTVRSNEGKVAVSVELEPQLQPGHKVRLSLDGVAIQPAFTSQQASLTGIERGTHTIGAEVIAENGTRLFNASSVAFTLRKDAIKPEPRPEPLPEPGNGGGTSSTGNNAGPAGPSFTPGRTNPAFTPNFSR